jgi:hypothetical protein
VNAPIDPHQDRHVISGSSEHSFRKIPVRIPNPRLQPFDRRVVGNNPCQRKTPRRIVWRMSMFRKIAFGLVAAASLSAAALAPTAASAKPFGGGFAGGWGGGFHHHHIGLGLGFVGVGLGESCYVSQPVLTPFGYRMRLVNVCY